MSFSRRNFFQVAGAGAVGSLLLPFVSGRGLEALTLGDNPRSDDALLASGSIRLNSNENPNGPGKVAFGGISAAFAEANRYPRSSETGLRAAVADHFKLAPENVQLGCGSTDILRASVYAYTGPNRALVVASPTFESPGTDAKRIGAPVREVPVTGDLKLDLDAMAVAARGAGLVYLCNPNNPTSTVHGAAAVKTFVDRIMKDSPDTTILIDEAYHEYVDDPSYATAIPLAMENPGVIVARTFSKVYGMAGMRVGYALAKPETIKTLAPCTLPNGVNELGASGATAALKAKAHIEQERVLNRAARAFTIKALADAGFSPADSQANFLMVNLRRDAQPFRDACKAQGVLVGRPFPPLNSYCRISIGTMDEMRKAVDVFRRALATA
ncbi:MAG: aminotransferase class I/II-fold pyridoxal phosphate-dependent enzyme [bacterium]